jgi:hypothetical protein
MTAQQLPAKRLSGAPRPSRLLFAIGISFLLAPLAYTVGKALFAPSIPFIIPDDKAAWIMYPREPRTEMYLVNPNEVRSSSFIKTFTVAGLPGDVRMHVRALAQVVVYVNGVMLPPEELASPSFRQEACLDVGAYLRPGVNEIRAEVKNPRGPELLHLWLEGLPEPLATDATWTVRGDSGPSEQAVVADDTRMHPESFVLDTPLQSLLHRRETLLLLFASSCGLFFVGRACWQGCDLAQLTRATLIILSVCWLVLFDHKLRKIPKELGFDARSHLAYIDYVGDHARIPRPDEGWSMYHPPLFYVLSALLLRIGQPLVAQGDLLLLVRFIPFASGLANVWLTHALARQVFPKGSAAVLFAVLIAGTLPMNLYLSAYVSNESLHACLATSCLLACVVLLKGGSIRLRQALLAGGLFGLALLVKFTAVLFLALACCVLAWKIVRIEGRTATRALALVAALLLGVFAVSGWYFVKNSVESGRPVGDNWGTFREIIWWQQPGWHTPRYYLTFGEALRHPYFSAFHSFWDGVYSTLWGDGLCAGVVATKYRNPQWNHDYMSAAYLLALPATLLMGVGLMQMLTAAVRDEDPRRRLVFLLLATAVLWMGSAILYYSLMLPSYAAAKAFYGLGLLGPLSIAAASGLATVDRLLQSRRFLAIRTVFYGWFGTLIAVLYLSFAG